MATSTIPAPEPAEMEFGGDGFPELPENLQKALKGLLRKALQREMYARRQEVMESRKQQFYDRGIDYFFWDYGAWGFAPLTAGPGSSPEGNGWYQDVYNIFHPFVRATIAAGTANSPGVHIEARSNKTADTIGAESADMYREFVEPLETSSVTSQDFLQSMVCHSVCHVVYIRQFSREQCQVSISSFKLGLSKYLITNHCFCIIDTSLVMVFSGVEWPFYIA